MTAPHVATAPLRFGRFELQPHERRLLVDGVAARLGGRAFDLLLALAERPGRLVDKATLIDLVWPGLVVQENNLAAQMSALRRLLGDGVITTIPGRGYRFVARLEAMGAGERDLEAEASNPRAGPAGSAAPPPSLRTNLPAELPALLGRAAELDELGRLVDRARLVTVVGAGGIGKTLLTRHMLAARRSRYAHGVCWIELGAVHDAAALPGTLAAALGVRGGQGDALEALRAAVSSLTMLLALDNAEHLLADVAALCQALLDTAPGLRFVATSQAPLRLATEQVLRIGPLAVPEPPVPAAEALRFGAVALFAERAAAVDRRFVVSEANVAAVIDVCGALDGLPLAIELASARAPRLGVARLQASMHERFALLTQGRDRAAPARQRTLRAALEWSHALLAPCEQVVFRRLGVVAGSASLALVEQMLVDPGDEAAPDRWSVIDALDALADRSLVSVLDAAEGTGIEPRYRLLETPRAFALECLDLAGERPAMQRLHACAVAGLFDAAYEEFWRGGVGADDWVRRREPDLDNARDALQWARSAGDAEIGLRIGATMLRALPPSLHVERMALADAIAARIDPHVPEPLQMKAWLELSTVLADTQKQRARQAAARALALARRLDTQAEDRFPLYLALCRASSAAAQDDDLVEARTLHAEAQALQDARWPPHRLLWGTEAGQWVARMAGDAGQALRLGRRLLALDRARGSDAAIATGNLIDAELAAGHAAAAAQLGQELVTALQGTRHEYSLAFARINLLAALLARDDVAAARPVAEAAWAKASTFDLQHAAAAYLALLCALDRRPRAAVRLAACSEAIYAARSETREHNETAATQRALALAEAALGATTVASLRTGVTVLDDEAVAALAFGHADEDAPRGVGRAD